LGLTVAEIDRDQAPTSVIGLIFGIWMSLTRPRAIYAVAILLGAGIAASIVLVGIALLVHLMAGSAASVWFAAGGTGLVATTAGYQRGRRSRQLKAKE
jgi:hypothetical protein